MSASDIPVRVSPHACIKPDNYPEFSDAAYCIAAESFHAVHDLCRFTLLSAAGIEELLTCNEIEYRDEEGRDKLGYQVCDSEQARPYPHEQVVQKKADDRQYDEYSELSFS